MCFRSSSLSDFLAEMAWSRGYIGVYHRQGSLSSSLSQLVASGIISHAGTMSKQEPLVVPPDTHSPDGAPIYPPPPGNQSTITSTQPSIDITEQDGRAESLMASCSEVDAKGRPVGKPVASRSFFFQTIFVSIVAFPQLLAEAHIGMLIVPLLDIGRQVDTEDEHQLSWFPAAYG